ncbi:MAG: hypothetical protein WCO52_04975 [bacterium]
MKSVIKFAIEGLALGAFTVAMLIEIMRLLIPAATLDTYKIPNGINTVGAVELIAIYVVVTVVVGMAVEYLAANLGKKEL